MTALLIVGAAAEVTGRTEAVLCGIAYLTMPFASLGSVLISTDTVLLPFFAAAVWLWLRLARSPSPGLAALLGLCLGLGFMAKYAAIYFALGTAVGALLPQARIAWRDLGVAAAVACVVIAPNVVWNLRNDLVTLTHTAENVDWVNDTALSLHPDRAAEFFGEQFIVMGPVLFGAYLWAVWTAFRRGPWQARWLVAMSAPILLLVLGQAALSRAYANWAVTAFVAATLLTVPMLWQRAKVVFWIGLALNLAVAAALPVVIMYSDSLMARDGERLLLEDVGLWKRQLGPAVQDLLDLGHRQRSLGRDRGQALHGRGQQLLGGQHPVTQPDPQGLVGPDHVAGHAQLERSRQAHAPR